MRKTDCPYVPGYLQKKPDDQEQLKKVEIERNIRSILNKIAPQNFESCFSQLTTTCDIGSIQGLNACVDIIFDKATREKSYSSVFAEICKRLAFLKVNFPEQSQENKQFIGFRSLLLKKCQEMFETPLKEQMEQKGAQWQEKIDAEEKEDKKKALEEERDEQMKKAKDQYYGNIRFIGELFMKDILTANIIHQCIVSQLKSDHSSKSMFTESLECLCELLKTVGKKLESENNAKARIDQYFERIKKLINSKEIESKVRFRLQDIELEQKARQDEESWAQQLQQQTRGGRQGGFSRPPAGQTLAANSKWTPVTTTRKAQKMDARKMVIGSSQEQGQSQTRLGPSRPSFVAKARPSGKDDGGRGTPRLGSQKNSRESSASRGTSREASPHLDPQQLQQPAVAALAASGKMPRSQSSQELPARAVESPRSVEPPPIPRDVLERKSKNIMMEWLGSLCSLEDTKSNFIEISRHPEISAFVEQRASGEGGQLLFELLHSELLSSKDLIEGFSPIMEMADDFLSDFPLLSSYLGEIFSSFVQKAASYLSCVQQLVLRIPADLRDSSRRPLRGEVVSRALHLASGRLGHDRVGAAFREAGMAWHSLLELPQADAADFVAANKLEFTLHETTLSPSPIALDVVGERIEQKIGNADGDASAKDLLSEELIALIEKEVDKKQMESREFIRVLVRSVCRGCTQSKKLNKPLFLLVKPVLMRHIETHEQQQQVDKRPLFAYLDNAIICEDSFKQWYQEAGKELQDATQLESKKMFRRLLLPSRVPPLLLLALWLLLAGPEFAVADRSLWLESDSQCGVVRLSVSSRGLVQCLYECSILSWCLCARFADSECSLMLPGGEVSPTAAGLAAAGTVYKNQQFDFSSICKLPLSGCEQSTVYSTGNLCGKAADGNVAQAFSTCFCTESGVNEWWEAGTADPAFITEVTLYNRGDCCPHRLNNFVITVDGVACVDFVTSTAFSVRNFTCNMAGRRLRVTNRLNGHLTFCEVVAYGYM
uniref:MIF4G domain-containing protein n=1 Tax=Macrostomum lignano TaxID=282301 RepID=A0A1I8G5Z3_9PLAT